MTSEHMGLPTLDLAHNPISNEGKTNKWNVDPIQVPVGSVTRAWAKKFKETLNGLIQNIWVKVNLWRPKEDALYVNFHDSSFGII